MNNYTIRPCRGQEDARPQYELWLRATAELPRAWRSCLLNVEQQLSNAERFPKCRLYAEGSDGTFRGYIGNHPPFEWIAEQHGPPARSLGWAIPFGFPWTYPLDETLEAALYDELIAITPEIYAEFQRDIYVQRFRESWRRQIAFLEQRGWRLHDRLPLLGRDIGDSGPPPAELAIVTSKDLQLVSELSQADETCEGKYSAEDLQQRCAGGWITTESFWRLGDRGAFAIEQRGPWAGVTQFFARPDSWQETLRAAVAQAESTGAAEIYFTIQPHEERRRDALEGHGFHEVDAGVYYVRDAD